MYRVGTYLRYGTYGTTYGTYCGTVRYHSTWLGAQKVYTILHHLSSGIKFWLP